MTGEELRAALWLAGIRQASFARTLGVSPNTVNRWVQDAWVIPRYVEAYLELLAERQREVAVRDG